MDNILDKFGIYDFFALLLPGMFFIVMLVFIDFPLINEFSYPDSETIQVVAFILISYICGSIIQEIGSIIDKNTTKIRISARQKYLNDKEFSESQREKVKSLVNELLGKETDYTPKDNEYEDVFFKCKEYLEDEEKIEKADKLDAIFAMSRDFIVCNIFLIICIPINMYIHRTDIARDIICLLLLIFLSFPYYQRAKRYASMRVRCIFRRYMICQKSNEK